MMYSGSLMSFNRADTIKWFGQYVPLVFKPGLVRALDALKIIEMKIHSTRVTVHPRPIFILGNQKAGTSIIAALLGKLTGQAVSLDLVREYLSDGSVYIGLKNGRVTFEEFILRNKLDFSKKIIKEANLTPFFEHLVLRFPESQFVFIVRNPADNIRSQLNRLDLPGDRETISNEKLRRMKRSWHILVNGAWLGLNGRGYIEMLAERWRFLADIYLQNSHRMTLIRYEDFLKNKKGAIHGLSECLGLNPRYDISDSVDVQYQPKGDRGVDPVSFFGRDRLNRIEQICEHQMKRLGYGKRSAW